MKKTVIFSLFFLLILFVFSSNVKAVKCLDEKPSHEPNLFQINVTKTSATLYFTPVNNAVTGYTIIYGLERGRDDYGVSFPFGKYEGVIDFTINDLSPNTKYYFRVRADNGCRQGLMSDTMSVRTNWESKIYTRFKDSFPSSNYYNEIVTSVTPVFATEILGETTSSAKLTIQPTSLPTIPTKTDQVEEVSTKNISKYIFLVILLILLILLVLYFYKKGRFERIPA